MEAKHSDGPACFECARIRRVPVALPNGYPNVDRLDALIRHGVALGLFHPRALDEAAEIMAIEYRPQQ